NAPVTASSSSGPTGTNGTSSPQAGTFQKTQTVQNFKFDIVNMVRAGDMLELDYKITNLQSDDRVLFMSGLSTYFYDDLGNLYNANEYCLVSDCDGMRTADKVDSYVLNGEYRDFSRAEANIPSQIPINAKVIIRGIKNDATKLVRGTMVFRAKSGNAYSDFQLAYQNIPLKIEDKSSNPNEKVVGNQSYQLLGVQSKDNYQVIKFNFTNSASEVYSYRISGITIYDNIGNAYNSAGITFGQSNEFQSGYYSQYQQDLAPNSTMGTNIWIADVSPQATMFKRVDIEFEKYKLSWENIPIQGGSSSTGGSSGSMSSKSIATSNRNSNYLDYSDFETKVREKVDVTGKRVILEKIYFATGSDQLLSDSYPQLDDLAELLSLNPNLDVEVSGHTDNVGDAVSNMLLSQKRADAIKYYLIAKAIDPARVSSIGRGENEPVMSNDSEGGRKENRRVEIKVVN
ncbi:MAG TPA: OmpA family protein, partial [Saprospiraceae bacterium]|nr:OmpA family protein [Saprospiraceae bacterium]